MNDAGSNYSIIKLPVTRLRPTEEIDIEQARLLAKAIKEEGRWTAPILVERSHSVIMDGHHRCFCAIELCLAVVPCVLLSYDDPNLEVTYWADGAPVDAGRIIKAGLSGDLMKYKTTRHRLHVPLPSCSVTLEELRQRSLKQLVAQNGLK
ncbi:ParB N-terminal domain-containing protein [Bradyrhizobium barranii]|uniref:ParB N-terminal domain-containing protein n=1 Tax=Bradyrhizobium barranii TaxID=2992140 RepID=UPI0024B088B7|nr:ParB N-terminal domain-containing protein [Bradyrhizobium barranii]WFT97122.1 ParB N-terminal domain-containing protein [Bradyrhizobium barranii]